MTPPPPSPAVPSSAQQRRHLRFGWTSLLVFLTLGVVLEVLHGFKVGYYLDVGNETRRLLWRLAHAHGALLGLVHVAFAVSLPLLPRARGRGLASVGLIVASLLLPGGFFLGGLVVYGGDPGLGILLVPIGALALFVAVAAIAWACLRPADPGAPS